MIKYYCDVCGEEITGEWIETLEGRIDSKSRGKGNAAQFHFHYKCLCKFMNELKKEIKGKDNEK